MNQATTTTFLPLYRRWLLLAAMGLFCSCWWSCIIYAQSVTSAFLLAVFTSSTKQKWTNNKLKSKPFQVKKAKIVIVAFYVHFQSCCSQRKPWWVMRETWSEIKTFVHTCTHSLIKETIFFFWKKLIKSWSKVLIKFTFRKKISPHCDIGEMTSYIFCHVTREVKFAWKGKSLRKISQVKS